MQRSERYCSLYALLSQVLGQGRSGSALLQSTPCGTWHATKAPLFGSKESANHTLIDCEVLQRLLPSVDDPRCNGCFPRCVCRASVVLSSPRSPARTHTHTRTRTRTRIHTPHTTNTHHTPHTHARARTRTNTRTRARRRTDAHAHKYTHTARARAEHNAPNPLPNYCTTAWSKRHVRFAWLRLV
jgi:hypothetical protein